MTVTNSESVPVFRFNNVPDVTQRLFIDLKREVNKMSKKSIFTIIAIVCLIGGLVLGAFTDVANDLPAIALSAFGLGGLIIVTYKKSEKRDGVLIASIICMVISGFAAAFAEMSQDNFSKLISAIVSVVTLIIGILIPIISNALSKKKTE